MKIETGNKQSNLRRDWSESSEIVRRYWTVSKRKLDHREEKMSENQILAHE